MFYSQTVNQIDGYFIYQKIQVFLENIRSPLVKSAYYIFASN